jgi:hypothetical protein
VPADLAGLIHSIADATHHVLQLWLAQSPSLLQHKHYIAEQMLRAATSLWGFPWADDSQAALREKWLTPGTVQCRVKGLWVMALTAVVVVRAPGGAAVIWFKGCRVVGFSADMVIKRCCVGVC